MSFYNNFDGYFVIHSASLNPERGNQFSCELRRIGIDAFEVISPSQIEKNDPRLAAYGDDGAKLVSLIDCFNRAVTIANSKSLRSIVIFEDDIKFRSNFGLLWKQVEPIVHRTEWEILVLHRSRDHNDRAVVEKRREKTRLVKIRHNTLTHCIALRKKAYSKFERSLEYCVEMGYPADFFYGVFTHNNSGVIYATTKNLTGQAGNLTSSLQGGIKKRYFHSEFSCYRNRLEWLLIAAIRGLRGFAQQFILSRRRHSAGRHFWSSHSSD